MEKSFEQIARLEWKRQNYCRRERVKIVNFGKGKYLNDGCETNDVNCI